MPDKKSLSVYVDITDPTSRSNYAAGYRYGDFWINEHSGAIFLTNANGSWLDVTDIITNVAGITATDILNWNTAFGWGDHAAEGYYKAGDIINAAELQIGGVTVIDALREGLFTALQVGVQIVTQTDISNFKDAYSWGDHALAGYLTVETDPIFSAHPAFGVTNAGAGNLFLADDGIYKAPGSAVWYPTAITLSDGTTNGATLILAVGAGYYVNFATNADQEWLCNVGLSRNGMAYDGSNLRLDLNWMLFGAPAGGDTLRWELDYYFANNGSNSYTGSNGTIINQPAIGGRVSQIQYTDSFPVISGPVGSTHLQLTLRRNGQGGQSDNYGGEAELYGINLVKV